ncbi:hypothetical protein D9B78_23115 [Serratia marcescens]|nr:hypothetical protein D9B78_23115 [Serratia marcescens]
MGRSERRPDWARPARRARSVHAVREKTEHCPGSSWRCSVDDHIKSLLRPARRYECAPRAPRRRRRFCRRRSCRSARSA